MPYLNYGGVIGKDLETAYHLVDRAIELAERLDTRTLELRQEYELDHPGFISWRGKKVHMRLALPDSIANLWKQLDSKVRNQIRKGEKAELKVVWEGSPCWMSSTTSSATTCGTSARRCIAAISSAPHCDSFPIEWKVSSCGWEEAHRRRPPGPRVGVTEIPSASSLRRYNLHLRQHAPVLERPRASDGAEPNLFRLRRLEPRQPDLQVQAQWGAQPEPSVWHYHIADGGRFGHASR